ncbi:hypothetical protein M758_5G018700 [Ceratodon purpureus]|uniref:Uncharacterized protein n=1 Tax=Ceratodon purpureus TaxID=3225 RepID=A0A8T0HWW8_CERPU|nr:hypothetical protein KC19_5G016600 [Ceratodon purpureus]KAG0615148.1 hypothetical protein M758_5G018700 [Ceratodon purpureus]
MAFRTVWSHADCLATTNRKSLKCSQLANRKLAFVEVS